MGVPILPCFFLNPWPRWLPDSIQWNDPGVLPDNTLKNGVRDCHVSSLDARNAMSTPPRHHTMARFAPPPCQNRWKTCRPNTSPHFYRELGSIHQFRLPGGNKLLAWRQWRYRRGWGVFSDLFSLVVCTVNSEEHRSEIMVGIERGAWSLGMKR